MKKYLVYLMMLFSFNGIAIAQNHDTNYSDPQITDGNYKHPNKAAQAKKDGRDHHIVTVKAEVEENSNYKKSFGRKNKMNRTQLSTGNSPVRTYSGKRTNSNYKRQF